LRNARLPLTVGLTSTRKPSRSSLLNDDQGLSLLEREVYYPTDNLWKA